MREKTKRDWRSWGMYPGRRYYVVAAGRPEKVGDDTRHVVHYITTRDGTNVMFVFSTPEKARRFIRKSLEGDPQAYLDFVEDTKGDLPAGLREGAYTVIGNTPDGLAEMGLQIGIHGMVLDPRPGMNQPIPLGAAEPVLDPEGDYYVVLFGRGPEAGSFFHYANHEGEEVLPIFTSQERMAEFVGEHARVNTGHLNVLRMEGADNVITPKRPVAGALLKDETGRVSGGLLSPVVETLAVIAGGLDARYVVVDPGKSDSRYLERPAEAA